MESFVRGNPPAKPALCTYDAARTLMRRRLNAMRGSLVEESFVEQKGSLLEHAAVCPTKLCLLSRLEQLPNHLSRYLKTMCSEGQKKRSRNILTPLSELTGKVKRS